MKVLMLTDRMDTGGAETHIAVLANELKERGVEVAVLSGGGRIADQLEREQIGRYDLLPAGRSVTGILRNRFLVRKLCEREGFDVLHAHARIPALCIAGCGKWKESPAEIVTVHADFRPMPLFNGIFRWGEKTVAVSEDLRAVVCDGFGVPAEAVTVIPNGVDPRRFFPPEQEAPPESVLFASRMDGDCSKGAELLCRIAPELARRYPRLRITFAGGGDRLPELKRTAEATNRSFREKTGREEALLTVLGDVADMPEVCRRHRIFVGVSRAALEAAMCGCAVVLCGNEGYGGILSPEFPAPAWSNFCCRGFPPATAENLTESLSELLSGDRHKRYAARGTEWIRHEYGSGRMAEQTLEVYRTALACREHSGGKRRWGKERSASCRIR